MLGKLSVKGIMISISVAGVLLIFLQAADVAMGNAYMFMNTEEVYYNSVMTEDYTRWLEINELLQSARIWMKLTLQPALCLILLWNGVDIVYRILSKCEKMKKIVPFDQQTEQQTEEQDKETEETERQQETKREEESYEAFRRPEK